MADPLTVARDMLAELAGLAEASGNERRTAARLAEFLAPLASDVTTGLAGHGLIATFPGLEPGPTVALRAELDAVPAENGGHAHLCGHDGHMALLCGLAAHLAQSPLARGRAALVFQPAEETGAGGPALAAEPAWAALNPDLCFALHNLPGRPAGLVLARSGAMHCASVGLEARLIGSPAHAAQPEAGRSPAPALARALGELPGLSGPGQAVTLCHAGLGRPGFGVAAGSALIMATLRAGDDAGFAELRGRCAGFLRALAEEHGLGLELNWREEFAATVNHPEAFAVVKAAAGDAGLSFEEPAGPMPWSEDFGALAAGRKGAIFWLGAGEGAGALHGAGYAFPPALLPAGLDLWRALVRRLLS